MSPAIVYLRTLSIAVNTVTLVSFFVFVQGNSIWYAVALVMMVERVLNFAIIVIS